MNFELKEIMDLIGSNGLSIEVLLLFAYLIYTRKKDAKVAKEFHKFMLRGMSITLNTCECLLKKATNDKLNGEVNECKKDITEFKKDLNEFKNETISDYI